MFSEILLYSYMHDVHNPSSEALQCHGVSFTFIWHQLGIPIS